MTHATWNSRAREVLRAFEAWFSNPTKTTLTGRAVRAARKLLATQAADDDCLVYRTLCQKHGGFVHGAEAEDLRAGIEKIIADDAELGHVEDVFSALRALLDSVDARDSLAYREATRRRRSPQGEGRGR